MLPQAQLPFESAVVGGVIWYEPPGGGERVPVYIDGTQAFAKKIVIESGLSPLDPRTITAEYDYSDVTAGIEAGGGVILYTSLEIAIYDALGRMCGFGVTPADPSLDNGTAGSSLLVAFGDSMQLLGGNWILGRDAKLEAAWPGYVE